MRKSVTLALGAFALAAASGAQAELQPPSEHTAQASPSSPGSDMNRDRPSTPPAASPTTPRSGATTGPGGAGTDALMKDKDVVDTSGDKIGKVKEVVGQDVVVSVGGFLGMGERDVRIPRDRLTVTGSGDDAKIMTSMTKEQLKALADDRAGTGAGSTPAPAPRSAPTR
jgi:hypothetical protein